MKLVNKKRSNNDLEDMQNMSDSKLGFLSLETRVSGQSSLIDDLSLGEI